MKTKWTHFKLSENSIFIKWIDIKTSTSFKTSETSQSWYISPWSKAQADMQHGLIRCTLKVKPDSLMVTHCRPTRNSSAKLGGKVRNGSSGQGHGELRVRSERWVTPVLGSDKREAGGSTRLFRTANALCLRTIFLDTCQRRGRHVEN